MGALLALKHELTIPMVECQSSEASRVSFTDGPCHLTGYDAFTSCGFQDVGFADFDIFLGTLAHLVFTLTGHQFLPHFRGRQSNERQLTGFRTKVRRTAPVEGRTSDHIVLQRLGTTVSVGTFDTGMFTGHVGGSGYYCN